MDRDDAQSIFSRYYAEEPFVDRFQTDKGRGVDVVIPIIHTNELWRANLASIYREVPVHRLLLGDGGCIDGSIEVARQFPRVEVLDHRRFVSLGFSIRHLIEAVQTEWFVYLHSDVYLPPGWFDAMSAHRSEFDWFECPQRITVMADYLYDTTKASRAYSGSQMGRKAAFESVLPKIDDDYLYRNEDIIIAELVKGAGFRYGKVGEVTHFHQVMHKPSRWRRAVKRVDVHLDLGHDEDVRANETYALGIVKYLDPASASDDIALSVRGAIDHLVLIEATTRTAFLDRIGEINPAWRVRLATMFRRDWIADRLAGIAETYRFYGFSGVASGIWKGILRRLGSMREGTSPESAGRNRKADRLILLARVYGRFGAAGATKYVLAPWIRSGVKAALPPLIEPLPYGTRRERMVRKMITAANLYRNQGLLRTLAYGMGRGLCRLIPLR